MSIEIVKSEIKRFLASDEPEVLCIKGRWGVGKTFAWRQYLEEAERNKQLGLAKYAYVSLFGLNGLESLRYAIFESTVSVGEFLKSANVATLGKMLDRVKELGRKGLPLYVATANKYGGTGAGDALSRAAFLAVRNQYICLDDLERSGSSLKILDVLGLASMLKEQRHCKVILLLNEEKLDDEARGEFQRQLEKVVDVSIVFDPSPQEAVTIAFSNETPVNTKLSPKLITLGVTNIRVIKKIERLSIRLSELLANHRAEVLDQALHAVALAGLAVFQPDIAPPIDFIRRHNSILSAMRKDKNDLPERERLWEALIEDYGWSYCDELDEAIFWGVASGYFNEAKIVDGADKVQTAFVNDKENSPFSKAWRLYHDSFVVDDGRILDALYEGAKNSLNTVSVLNLNATTMLMREFGRVDQADELANLYLSQPLIDANQLDEQIKMWGTEAVDPALSSGFEKLKNDFVDDRNPRDVLIDMVTNRGWNEADLDLLAKQSAKDFENIFESIEGPNLSSVVKFALSLGGHEGPNHKAIGAAVIAALQAIATKSPLRKRKIANFGVQVD